MIWVRLVYSMSIFKHQEQKQACGCRKKETAKVKSGHGLMGLGRQWVGTICLGCCSVGLKYSLPMLTLGNRTIFSQISNGYRTSCQAFPPNLGQPPVSMGYFQEWVRRIQIGIGTRHSRDCMVLPRKSEDLICQPKKVRFFTSLAAQQPSMFRQESI